MTIGKLGMILFFGGVVAFLCGLARVFNNYGQREHDMLAYAGGILFLVGIGFVAVSLYGKGKV